eukprot:384880-Rhodomonas_salina.2
MWSSRHGTGEIGIKAHLPPHVTSEREHNARAAIEHNMLLLGGHASQTLLRDGDDAGVLGQKAPEVVVEELEG